ncbi:hypothetical protein D3C86_1218620 [compost metagenome]
MIPHRRRRGPLQQVGQEDLGHQHGTAAAPEHRAPRGQHRHVPHGRHHAGQGLPQRMVRMQPRELERLAPHARIDEQRAAQRALPQPAQERPVARGMMRIDDAMGEDGWHIVADEQHFARDSRHRADQADGLPFIGKRPLERLGQPLDTELRGSGHQPGGERALANHPAAQVGGDVGVERQMRPPRAGARRPVQRIAHARSGREAEAGSLPPGP